MISPLITGPMLASWRTSSIGPNLAWSALLSSNSLPDVGRPMVPPPVVGDADGLAPGTAAAEEPGDAEGPGDALGSGDVPADAPGDADADAAPDAAGEPDAPGDADAPGEPDAPGDGLATGVCSSWRPIWIVRIWTYDLSPAVVIATEPGRPCSSMTA